MHILPGAILDNDPSQMLKTHSDQVPNLKLWQAASFQYLQSVVGRIGGLLYLLMSRRNYGASHRE